MAIPDERSSTPLLDDWIAEVGEERVAAAVRAAQQDIADGTLPAFADKDSLLEYWNRGRRQSA
jgi:hypothetical protein